MKFLQIITLLTLISVKAFIPDPNLLLKKNLILLIIKISQEGDQIGTFVLENFYKITDFLL